MITLFTGVPGAGKTLLSLDRLIKEFLKHPDNKFRPIYVDGIPDLDYDYFRAKPIPDVEKWYELPDTSVIIIDEAQRVFPQRGAKEDVPQKCREFETHRHKGMDVFITTQNPMLVDVHLRRLVGRHLHVDRILNRKVATIFEYKEYKTEPTGFHEKKEAISVTAWPYPKDLFKRYKSATMHTYKARTPWKLYAIPIVAVLSIAAMYKGITGVAGGGKTAVDTSAAAAERNLGTNLAGMADKGLDLKLITPGQWFNAYQPAVKGILHTAPVYAQLTQPETFPKPYCIIHDDGNQCSCYTQQLTQYNTQEEFCRDWAENGFFDVTKPDHDKRKDGQRSAGAEAPRAPTWTPDTSYTKQRSEAQSSRVPGIKTMQPANMVIPELRPKYSGY